MNKICSFSYFVLGMLVYVLLGSKRLVFCVIQLSLLYCVAGWWRRNETRN